MQKGSIGIVPPGALSVSFFNYLTKGMEHLDERVFFIGLEQSKSVDSMMKGHLNVVNGDSIKCISMENIFYRSLKSMPVEKLPEVLLVCSTPDRLLPFMSNYVLLIEQIYHHSRQELRGARLPYILLCSNGIYFQRIRQMFIEQLEEATLLGRLPDLWPDIMPYIVGHLIRCVTLQTGLRKGSGPTATYHPGPPGRSILTGGDEKIRHKCRDILVAHGGLFECPVGVTPTQAEFKKAIVNLTVNLLGMIYAFATPGKFNVLTIQDILVSENRTALRDLAYHVFKVGSAVKAFKPDDTAEDVFNTTLLTCEKIKEHTPSSIQAIDLEIQAGTLNAEFPPTETWLIEPLIHYARSSGLPETADYLETLRKTLIDRISLFKAGGGV